MVRNADGKKAPRGALTKKYGWVVLDLIEPTRSRINAMSCELRAHELLKQRHQGLDLNRKMGGKAAAVSKAIMYGVAIVYHPDGLLGAKGKLRLRDLFGDHSAYVAKLREVGVPVPREWEVRVPDVFSPAVRAAKGLNKESGGGAAGAGAGSGRHIKRNTLEGFLVSSGPSSGAGLSAGGTTSGETTEMDEMVSKVRKRARSEEEEGSEEEEEEEEEGSEEEEEEVPEDDDEGAAGGAGAAAGGAGAAADGEAVWNYSP